MYGHNPGHITRGDPVERTRKMLQREIADCKRELEIVTDEDERAQIEYDMEQAESHLASLNMCFL